MEKIATFPELAQLLLETKWDTRDSPLAKAEGDSIIFTQKNKRVDKRAKFRFLLGGNEVEYEAEQIVHCYRTRELPLKDYLMGARQMKKLISTTHRPLFLSMMQDGSFASAAASASAVPSANKASTEEESQRKRERPGHADERRDAKASRTAATGPPKVPTRLADVLRAEVQYYDRNQALIATRSFQEVIDLDSKAKVAQEEVKKGQRQKKSKPLGSPIIVVPPNPTAVLNLYNIKSFLEDMLYVSADDIKKKNPNETKPEFVYVTRRKHAQAGDIRFKVVDSVMNFDDATWDRVIAVVVSGQAWQLKGWKWSTPADIFARVRGLYVYFDDAKVTDQVKGWNVVSLPIKHQSRNKDIVQVHEIWKQVDNHLERQKPQILQSLVDEYETRMRAEREARQKGMQAQLEDEEEEDEYDNSQNAVMDA